MSDPRVPEDRPAKAAAQFLAAEPATSSDVLNAIADTRARLAYLIRAELVCCDIYEKTAGKWEALDVAAESGKLSVAVHKEAREAYQARLKAAKADGSYHAICYYGEWSARLCETGDLPQGELFYGEWNPAWGEPCEANRPKVVPDPPAPVAGPSGATWDPLETQAVNLDEVNP